MFEASIDNDVLLATIRLVPLVLRLLPVAAPGFGFTGGI